MSAETSGDVSLIKDEDLLRKMWQDSEDFGRKKEIRAHMYKLREARLREFYNSGEVSSDIKRTSTITTESKTCSGSTHADSLADHSFISMKTKEIRDSESPTKDDIYRIADKGANNQGWQIITSNNKSDDGKTHTTTKIATTSGSDKIQGGQINYAAKNEQQASVYKDGDDKNFTKAVGASSNTVIRQDASGGDENSSFRSSSTTTSSSSKFVSEHRSTSGDVETPVRMITNKEDLVSSKTYTDNIPNDLKNHPSYVEGRTKVTRETRTLPDGSTVTTTRYEIKGGDSIKKSSQYSTNEQRSSSSVVRSSQESRNESKSSRYIEQPSSTMTVTRHVETEIQPATTSTITRTIRTQQDDVSRGSTYEPQETTKTTVVKQIYNEPSTCYDRTVVDRCEPSITTSSNVTTKTTKVYSTSEPTVTTKTTLVTNIPETTIQTGKVTEDTKTVNKTTITRQVEDLRDHKSQDINEKFISVEQQDTRNKIERPRQPSAEKPVKQSEKPRKVEEKLPSPERRQPIKPGKSEFDERPKATEGQYETTYRTEFTNKRISVDVSPTHDAFARSLRAVSPDRASNLRTSTSSLRSSTSPEKNRHPSRVSPDRRSVSPKKTISTETITKSRRTTNEIDSSTLTRQKKRPTRSRTPSPTTTASDIEFIRTNIVTDLDTNETTITTQCRPSALDITTKNVKKITERSPTSPLTDSAKKNVRDVGRTNSLRSISPTKEGGKPDRPLKRTDTYEERCRQILGITNETTKKKTNETRRMSGSKVTPLSSPEKKTEKQTPRVQSSPERRSPVKDANKVSEFPSQIRRSPEKVASQPYPEKKSPVKDVSKINEFPSQIRRTPQKEPWQQYPEKKSPTKEGPKISEFPSQIRKSPEKQPLQQYPEKKSPTKEGPKINEFPSQIRKSPEKEPLQPYPERKNPTKEAPKINEFPSQIKKSPEKEPLQPYPERKSPTKEGPKINEFPSQIKKSPEKEPLQSYPEKKSPTKEGPKINEFPSQIRRSPEKEPLEPYPEKRSPTKEGPKISEFPSQIRKSPEREPLEPYPEKRRPTKEGPKISEFPSQIKKSPENEPLEPYPKKKSPTKEGPKICEFPSQIRRVPEEEPKRKIPLKETSDIDDYSCQIKETTDERTTRISEFPSQIRKVPGKEPLEPYPEKQTPVKETPKISEFPSQIRKSSENRTTETNGTTYVKNTTITKRHEKYPEISVTDRSESPELSEDDKQPENGYKPCEKKSQVTEFPSQKSPEKSKPKVDKPEKQNDVRKYPQKEPQSKQKTEISSITTKEKKITRGRPVSSSSDTDEEEIVEEINKISVPELEGKVPVNEPLVTKKFISQLCREDEIQRSNSTKKTTLDKEIIETGKKPNKTVKKSSPKRPEELFIENERKCEVKNLSPTKVTSPVKKPLVEKNNVVTNKRVVTKIETKLTKKTPEEKPKPKEVKKTERITLYDIENLNKNKKDTSIHVRTHRVDDTVSKKRSTVNVEITKKETKPTQVPKPIKFDKRPQKTLSKTKIETETKRVNEQKTPKRHVVTTTITVTPTKPKPKTKPKIQNGHVSSDESITDSLNEEIVTTRKEKISRVVETKKKPEKPEPTKTKQGKCITTKSIVINNETNEREVIVDLQRSKSSREPTPDRICPLPVSSDEDSTPRYPDKIAEPDDSSLRRKPKKISDIPIFESEDLTQFSRITEIEDVESIDSSTVDKKINKFSETTQKLKQGPAPKVERPRLEVTEDLESDECLLSVSEKVNKFITTAEQLTTSQELPQRPKSPKCQYYPDDEVNVSDKVAHFITTAEKVITTPKGPAPKVERPTFEHLDDKIKEDDCLLSVSDKVSKFINTAEKLTTESKKNISLSKMDVKTPQESPKPQRKSPTKEATPTRKPSNDYSSINVDHQDGRYPRRDSSPKLPDSTPRSTRRPSEETPQPVLSPASRLRSTESVKKAKALFENISNDQKILKQRDILSRPSVFEGRKLKTETSRKLQYENDDDKTLKSTKLLLEKARGQSKSPERETVVFRRSQSPDGDIPGYMKPLDRSLRPNSPHRENINQLNKKHTTEETQDVCETKFGVTLRRTDSGRVISPTTTKRRMSVEVTEAEIEEIYDLKILEELLERVIGYELRRTIRSQIRLVKQLITEGKLEETIKKITQNRKNSKFVSSVETTEHRSSSYAYNERRTSSEYTKLSKRSQSPETKPVRNLSPERKITSTTTTTRVTKRSQSPEIKLVRTRSPDSKTTTTTTTTSTKVTRRHQSPEKSKIETRRSPDTKANREKTPDRPQTKSKLFQTQLKKTTQASKPVSDETPEWVKQRNLRKVTQSSVVTSTKTSSSTSSAKKTRTSVEKEIKPTDIITSSYGVGPTDEHGSPLFGLKALRVQNKTDTTKVQGTVIRSQYYSENGEEPVGEISVTKYSTDPRDLGRNEDSKSKGITSITTTQKFGYKDTPTLTSLTKKKKEICDVTEDTKSTKLNRRGSVKALSQKFTVETLKNDKQSSYPKAGLILRTSSFKDSASSGESREGSTERTTVKTTRTVTGETFLTNRSKVTGVQDVISRMKTEDIREGDSAEDIEARGLLNKFLGAQVLLSGIEANVKSSTTTTNARRSTKVTSTTTESGKPVTKTRVFQHPITDEDLQTVWDEQTLRLLLEQSTDYEERRKIRARLRQVMAEQEACTELVDKASQDQIATTFEESTQTKKSFTEGPVTTSQMTTKVTTQQIQSKKPISPFAKFRQLDKQNSLNSPSTPKTPSGSGPLFKFTDPAVSQSASTIKDRLLHWCRMKTKEYENIQLDNFSTCWADGLAFCALIHHFLPDAFDYHALSPKNRRHNFTLAFQVADEKADIAPLLDVDDMVATRKPDWKCVFTYVQSIYRRFKDED